MTDSHALAERTGEFYQLLDRIRYPFSKDELLKILGSNPELIPEILDDMTADRCNEEPLYGHPEFLDALALVIYYGQVSLTQQQMETLATRTSTVACIADNTAIKVRMMRA